MTLTLATVIFTLTYLLIATGRQKLLPIGRPGGALLGAVLMVACSVLTPKESYAAIDHDTIVVLFAMMLLAIYLEEDGFFLRIAAFLAKRSKTPLGLLFGISLLAGAMSAVLLNDTVCVFLTPLVVTICARAKLPMGPYLIGLATSANIGSSATMVGNPQNILIGSMSGISFVEFLKYSILPAAVGMAINIFLLRVYYAKKLPKTLDLKAFDGEPQRVPTAFINALEFQHRIPLASWVLLFVAAAFVAGYHLAYTTLAGVFLLIVIHRRDPRPELARIDWTLLVFFCGLFIVVAGFAKTGLPERAWRAAGPFMALDHATGISSFSAMLVAGSNIVSNVPMVLLAGPHLGAQQNDIFPWLLTAYVTTIAGNLTLVGSVANIIVSEAAREHYSLGFREFLRFGAISTVAVLAAGIPLLYFLTH